MFGPYSAGRIITRAAVVSLRSKRASLTDRAVVLVTILGLNLEQWTFSTARQELWGLVGVARALSAALAPTWRFTAPSMGIPQAAALGAMYISGSPMPAGEDQEERSIYHDHHRS